MTGIAVAIDLGGTQLRAALIDNVGTILARTVVPTAAMSGPEVVINQISDAIAEIAHGIPKKDIIGVGVSSPGPLDTVKGIALSIPTLAGFEEFPMTRVLQDRIDHPVTLENDGIAAAIGEWKFGGGRNVNNLVYVTVSTGIGGGVISDGRVLRGRKGMAGHVGHMVIEQGGEACSCGNLGCWEAYGSGTAFARRARLRAMTCAETMLGSAGELIEASAVFDAARLRDALSLDLIAEEADILATGIVSLLHLYSPEIVILGGGMINGLDMLYPTISASVKSRAMPAFRDIPILRSELGDNSGLLGAAALVHHRIDI